MIILVCHQRHQLSQQVTRMAIFFTLPPQHCAGVSNKDQLNWPSCGSRNDHGTRRLIVERPGQSSSVSEESQLRPVVLDRVGVEMERPAHAGVYQGLSVVLRLDSRLPGRVNRGSLQ